MGYLKIIAAILIWSSLGIFIRKIELPNHCIIFYASTVAGLLQFILLTSTGLLKKVRHAESSVRSAVFLVIAPVCFIANALLFYFAFRNTTIANAVLTHYTAPVFVAILAPLLLKEKIRKTAWVAIVLSSIGLWFILGGKGGISEQSQFDREHLGIIAGALSGLAYAFLILTIRRIAALYSSLFITFIQNGIVTLLLLPFVYSVPLPMHDLPYLITMGILHSTIAPLLYVQGFRSVRASEAAILGYFEPIGATVLALIFLREVPGFQALIGGALILSSGYMILRGKGKRERFCLTEDVVSKIYKHAVEEYPDECCGIITGSGDIQTVHLCKNIQNRLHAEDPARYPRNARTAYTIDRGEFDEIIASARQKGQHVLALYHSHCDHESYFSEEDVAAQTVLGEPEFPDAYHVVVSVMHGSMHAIKCYRWDRKMKVFSAVRDFC